MDDVLWFTARGAGTRTSLLLRHVGPRAWRAVHWASYACWALALVHGITAGTEASTAWMLAVDLVCVSALAACLSARVVARATMARTPAAPRATPGNGG